MDKNIKWKLSEEGACLCLGSGQLFFKSKRPQGISYNEIMQMIQASPSKSAYVKVRKHRLTLGKAIVMDELELIGKEVNLSTTIDLNTITHDRDFDKLPETGKDILNKIYDSKPYMINEV